MQPNLIPQDLQDKVATWQQNAQAESQQTKALQDVMHALQTVAMAFQTASVSLAQSDNRSERSAGEFSQLVTQFQDALKGLQALKPQEMPDYAQPVVEAVSRLENALTSTIGSLNLSPEVKPNITVSAPDVKVDAPVIDLSRIEKVLKGDLPKAFQKAVAAIPQTEIPEVDNQPILDALNAMLTQLASIDTATRLKPSMGVLKVTNPDGSNIGGSQRTSLDNMHTTITSSTAETAITSSDPNYHLDLYGLVLTNTSATATSVTIRDALTETTRFIFEVPATDTRGFMVPSSAAHKQSGLNATWTATCGTSVASLEVSAMWIKNT